MDQKIEELSANFDRDVPPFPNIANMPRTTIPTNLSFVLGDQRRRSMDSRYFGASIRTITLIGMIIACAGCGETRSNPTSQAVSSDPGAMKTRKTSPDGDPIAEVSSAGWPHTTKKHAGELLYLAPDGTEQITDLGDDTVAHVMNKFHESQADELKYELHYLRHRDGNDLYQLDYSWKTGENIVLEAQGGPVTYTGSDETMVNAREHGKFILRPASK